MIFGHRPDSTPGLSGWDSTRWVFVTMREADHAAVAAFGDAVAEIEHVVSAQRLFGDPDYLLRVLVSDLAAFQRLYDDRLNALLGVQRLSTTLVMKNVVEDRPLPTTGEPGHPTSR